MWLVMLGDRGFCGEDWNVRVLYGFDTKKKADAEVERLMEKRSKDEQTYLSYYASSCPLR